MLRRFVHWFLKKVFQVLFRVRVEGCREKMNASRLIIVANQESFLDELFLGLFLPYDPVFVVHTCVTRNRFLRLVLSQVVHLAVDPSNPMAVKKVIRLIEPDHLAGGILMNIPIPYCWPSVAARVFIQES